MLNIIALLIGIFSSIALLIVAIVIKIKTHRLINNQKNPFMKFHFITARRICKVYFTVYYSFDEQKPYRKYSIRKQACLCFLGVPYKIVSEIYVPAHFKDLE